MTDAGNLFQVLITVTKKSDSLDDNQTCKYRFVCLELPVADDERDVAEGSALEQKTKLVTESTARNFDWSHTRLASHVHRFTDHTHLNTSSQSRYEKRKQLSK